MLPIPTATTRAWFVALAALIGIGLASRSVALLALAGGGACALAFTLALSIPMGRRVRRERLEFAWWLDQGRASTGGAVVPEVPFSIRCYVRHGGSDSLVCMGLSPIVPLGVRCLDDPRRPIEVAPGLRTEVEIRLVAPATGRVVLHGLALNLRGPLGLFEIPLYFPNPLSIKVLPRSGTRLRTRAQTITGTSTSRAGRTQLRRRGGGTELHELRELLPGDPFRSIAWKASARVGRLMVKEVEREVQETRWVVLDVSGTMRGGSPGRRKLDFAIEATAAEAREALESGDRFGLLTVDGRILAHVAPREGIGQMIHVYDALLGATEIVDCDLTFVDDDEVLAIVVRYLREQQGIDFRRAGAVDLASLVVHLKRNLGPTPKEPVQATSAAGTLARRFCRERGIRLPYRPDPRHGAKEGGLVAGLRIAGGKRVPSSILVLSDLDGMVEEEPLLAMLRLVRAHGHAVSFVIPDGPALCPEPVGALERDLHRIFDRAELRRTRHARRLLGRLGIPVVSAPLRRPMGAPSFAGASPGGAR